MKYALLLLFILIYTDSCNSKKDSAQKLEGSWKIASIEDKKMNSEKATITINTSDRSINASVGCNNHIGNILIVKDEIRISNLIATEMYCQDLDAMERSLASNLRITTNYKLEDDKLLLYGPNGVVIELVK